MWSGGGGRCDRGKSVKREGTILDFNYYIIYSKNRLCSIQNSEMF